MKFETIFRRLNDEAIAHRDENATTRLEACRQSAFRIESECERSDSKRNLRITIAKTRCRGFVSVSLQHRQGRGWETRAFGYLDTLGKEQPHFLTRADTLGGDVQIRRTEVPSEGIIRRLLPRLDELEAKWKAELPA